MNNFFLATQDSFLGIKELLQSALQHNKLNGLRTLCCYGLVGLLAMINPIIMGYLATVKGAFSLGLLFFLLINNACLCFLTLLCVIWLVRFSTVAVYNVQSLVMKRLLSLNIFSLEQYAIGDLCQRVLFFELLIQALSPIQFGLVLTCLFSAGSFLVMLWCSWQLALSVLCFMIIVMSLIVLNTQKQIPQMLQRMHGLGEAAAFLFQMIHGITRLKLFHKEASAYSAWNALYTRAHKHLEKIYQLAIWRFTLVSLLPLMALCGLFFLAMQMDKTSLSLQQFIIFLSAFMQFITGFVGCSLHANTLTPLICAYSRLQPLLQEPPEVLSLSKKINPVFDGSLSIQNVYFKYPNGSGMLLQGLCCSVKSNQHVALVGLSGSGKSTLIKLLLGFYSPNQGRIEYAGRPLTEYNLLDLRQQIGVVFQDSKLLSGTILDNIIGHDPNANEADAWRVAHLVGLDVFIASLPMGMYTMVSQHVNVLSGGQRQLILIAKALLGAPQLLLLDEATSSLDNAAQALVVNRINQLNITRLSIAHRLSTIKNADTIHVLAQGRIIESGSFMELMCLRGLFYRMAQQQGFDDGSSFE